MLTLIIFSTVTFCLETLPNFYEHETDTTSVWFIMEATCIAVFTAEFLGRLASTPDLRNYFNDTMNQVDVVAIMPFYLEIMLANVSIPGLSVFRVVRLVRVFRLFKVSRGSLTVRIKRDTHGLRVHATVWFHPRLEVDQSWARVMSQEIN